jgi:phenylalanyl-tRNA synthetase beta chain
MKVSLNWLKNYVEIPLTPDEVSALLTSLGLEVEGMEKTESIPGGLEGLVVGLVADCQKHPNADKLSLTKVDVGTGELLSVVCGAPNVAKGQKVIVATVGATLYPIEGEPFVIKKSKIRGEDSEGMICAEDEIGIGHSHAGIMVLPADTQVGLPARDYFRLETDYVYEIGLTPNRSDATNHLGVARDVAAALRINYGHSGELRLPDVSTFKVDNRDLALEVTVENTEACPRYCGVSLKGVTIKESPDWLKQRLQAVGVRPINNIVDATNFVLHELGQPLHAFDLDEIKGRKVFVKTLPEGSKFQSLDGVERALSAEDLMICDGNSNGMCIGGVFGGISSGVKDGTANIFLESAHFHPRWIRRSSMRHNLRTDAAKVFEKGSDPNISLYALQRAVLLIKELAGGEIASDIVDIYPKPIEPAKVELSYAHINKLIGIQIPAEKVKNILDALDMAIASEADGRLTVTVPTNKADVTREADVIEEILRVYGFDNVPEPGIINMAMVTSVQPDPSQVRNTIADLLVANGFHEMMAMSLSEARIYKQIVGGTPEEALVFINNTSNVHLNIMRPTMVVSGLEAVVHNQNRQQLNLKLFEFGKTYRHKEGAIEETAHLSMLLAGQRWHESWLNKDKALVNFYHLKAFVKLVLNKMGVTQYQETPIKDDIFSYGVRYHRGEQVLVELGQVSAKVAKKMDVRGQVCFADLRWDNLLRSLAKNRVSYQEVSRFPSMRRDLALVVENSVRFSDIAAIAAKAGKKWLKDTNLFDVYVNEAQLGAGKKSYAVSFVFEDPEKTLQDKEVDQVVEQMIGAFETQLSAHIRR